MTQEDPDRLTFTPFLVTKVEERRKALRSFRVKNSEGEYETHVEYESTGFWLTLDPGNLSFHIGPYSHGWKVGDRLSLILVPLHDIENATPTRPRGVVGPHDE